mmetsp:Transcript_30108/g.55964  ORF Transcript_30108/g.55964 Transcript_30108/m.55964 type:complete len:444 (+) Transcript_30108:161-1492(+)
MSEVFVTVRKGDTFQGIALENSTTVSSLKKMNHIYGNNKLFVGQKLKVKESLPPSLLEASKTSTVSNSKLRRSSSGSIGWRGSGKQLSSPVGSVYDLITSSLWGTSPKKVDSQSKDTGHKEVESLSEGFRPRSSSGVGIEELENGEVIVTMPLTKSADFETCEPQADCVVTEPIVKVKKRNDELQYSLKNAAHSKDGAVSFLSTDDNRIVDTEFDAELVEVNEHYFSVTNRKGASKSGSKGRGSENGGGSGGGATTTRTRPRTKSIVKVELHGNGCILSQSHAQALAAYLPAILQSNKWSLLYSVLNNGADLFSFYKLTKGAGTTVLVVETMQGDVFGGFATEQWHVDTSFYGGGESFIFKIVDSKRVKVFKWSMENHFVMWSNEDQIAMGGGGDGFAFALDCDFYTGQTNSSATFNNDPLVSCEDHCFQVKNVEVWKLDSCI